MSNLIFLLVFVVGGSVGLQVFLCKIGERWLGLILPTITLLISLISALSIVPFTTRSSLSSYNEKGDIIQSYVYRVNTGGEHIPSAVIMTIMVFLIYNIPTVIFVGIYRYYRKQKIQNNELSKMSIHDLE